MLKRSLIVISLASLLVIGAVPNRSVDGVLMTGAEVEMLIAAATSHDEDGQPKNGNAFLRVLKVPFKAVGRLFGIGKKDDNKLQRLSRKDVKKFKPVGTTRVVDARTPAAPSVDSPTLGEPSDSGPTMDDLALAQENLERGRALLNSGNVNDAIAALSTAVSLDPNLKEAHNLLGVAYETKGMRDSAFKSFEMAIRGGQEQPEYLNNLGYLRFKNGDYDQAAKYLKRAVKAAPNVQRYWNNLGLVQAQRGKFDDAYKCFVRAVGEFEGHMNVANRSQAMGFDKVAIKHLEQARTLRPTTAEILLRLAVLYKRDGKAELAEEANSALVAVRALAAAKE